MKFRISIFLVLLFGAMLQYSAQQTQFVIKIGKFTSDVLSNEELTTLEKIVASYIAELGQFRIIDSKGQEVALTEIENSAAMGQSVNPQLLSPHYTITMHIGKLDSTFALTIEILKISTGEKRAKTEMVSNLNEILLKTRPMLYALMGIQSVAQPQPSMPQNDIQFRNSIQISDVVGVWKGDKGIDSIRLYADKTGIAVLSSGGTFKLRFKIESDTLIVEQDQKNMPEMYTSSTITSATAKLIAQKARPQRWIFKLSDSGQILSGVKESIYVSGSGTTVNVDNSYVRDAVWTRLH